MLGNMATFFSINNVLYQTGLLTKHGKINFLAAYNSKAFGAFNFYQWPGLLLILINQIYNRGRLVKRCIYYTFFLSNSSFVILNPDLHMGQ